MRMQWMWEKVDGFCGSVAISCCSKHCNSCGKHCNSATGASMWTATQFAKLHQCSVLTTTWGCATTHHSIAFRAKQPRRCSPPRATAAPAVIQEDQVPGMVPFLDSLKYNKDGHVAVIVQHVDTGEVLMQAFADRAALCETLQTRLATFYSRSRGGRWCKGETSGHFIKVQRIFLDCDKDSIIYLGEPIGPACHTGARTCWFEEVQGDAQGVEQVHDAATTIPSTTLFALEGIIEARKREIGVPDVKPSWTVKLLQNPELLTSKVMEEAGELCAAARDNEGRERVASEAADLLYHALVLLNTQGVQVEEVLATLRARFGTSGIDEKASRSKK